MSSRAGEVFLPPGAGRPSTQGQARAKGRGCHCDRGVCLPFCWADKAGAPFGGGEAHSWEAGSPEWGQPGKQRLGSTVDS